MDEKTKSIWKKSWKGWHGLLFWFLSLIIIAFGIFLSICMVVGKTNPIGIATILALSCALVGILTVAFIRWLCCWRNFKRFLFGLACFATLIALFYAEEDWRGKHDWEKFKREWEAKGEKFNFASVVPTPVPDDKNFAFSPVWIADIRQNFWGTSVKLKSWYGDQIDSEEVCNLLPLLPITTSTIVGTNMWRFSQPPDVKDSWDTGRFFDLKPYQSFYRDVGKTNPATQIIIAPQPQTPAQDVLLALSKFDLVIEQLRRDSAQPYSRFPLQYNDGMPAAILLPHLAAEKRFAEVLQLRAIAELQNGESKKAFDDVRLMLRLTDASRNEPFLICHLIRIAILNLTLQPIWEGLAEHKWSDAQLVDLDSELAKLDFLVDYQFAIRGERALEIANIEFFRHPPQNLDFRRPRLYFIAPFFYLMQELSNLSGSGGDENSQMGFQMLVLGFGPSGWLDQNELRIAQFETKWYLPIVDHEAQTISSAKIRAGDNALDQELRHRTPENLLEVWFMPALGGGARKFAYAQSSANLARVAIALERYRLAHGEYSDSLDALEPQCMEKIPHDIINGEPLHYRRTSDGQFVLYSVGWNETDDGGVVVFKNRSNPRDESKTGIDMDKGDWVWRYPSK